MKNLLIQLCVAMLFTCNISCSQDTEVKNSNSNQKEEAQYYVKYEIESKNLRYRGRKIEIDIKNESDQIESSIVDQTSFNEIVIGPVEKGFNAFVSVVSLSQTNYQLELNLKISVSKNNGPFALKESNLSTDARGSAELKYTIDF